jgi:hypothetical protein
MPGNSEVHRPLQNCGSLVCSMTLFWHLEFAVGSYIFGKFEDPCIKLSVKQPLELCKIPSYATICLSFIVKCYSLNGNESLNGAPFGWPLILASLYFSFFIKRYQTKLAQYEKLLHKVPWKPGHIIWSRSYKSV